MPGFLLAARTRACKALLRNRYLLALIINLVVADRVRDSYQSRSRMRYAPANTELLG